MPRVFQVVQVVQVIQVVRMVRIISPDDIQSENLWFSGSKPSNYKGKVRSHACDAVTDRGRRRKVKNIIVFWWTRNCKNLK